MPQPVGAATACERAFCAYQMRWAVQSLLGPMHLIRPLVRASPDYQMWDRTLASSVRGVGVAVSRSGRTSGGALPGSLAAPSDHLPADDRVWRTGDGVEVLSLGLTAAGPTACA